jgi:hypothetical protein
MTKSSKRGLSRLPSASSRSTPALMSVSDVYKAIRSRQWQRLFPKATAAWNAPRQREEGGLGIEGWLGLMTFLGVVLGLLYARLTLP